jgi:Leucine-rich repeat (LRR) protein
LRKVSISHCRFSVLPRELCYLPALEVLDASSNMMASLPRNLGMLTTLKSLSLADNGLNTIEGLPFNEWRELKHLDITSNKLLTLPRSLANLPSLCSVVLRGNLFDSPAVQHLKTIILTVRRTNRAVGPSLRTDFDTPPPGPERERSPANFNSPPLPKPAESPAEDPDELSSKDFASPAETPPGDSVDFC